MQHYVSKSTLLYILLQYTTSFSKDLVVLDYMLSSSEV